MHLILIPIYHTITHLCFGNEHTISSCVKMKSMIEEKSTVCGVMTSFLVSKGLTECMKSKSRVIAKNYPRS